MTHVKIVKLVLVVTPNGIVKTVRSRNDTQSLVSVVMINTNCNSVSVSLSRLLTNYTSVPALAFTQCESPILHVYVFMALVDGFS